MKWFGWAGTILKINLTNRVITKVPLDPDLVNQYLGGRGVNIKMLYDNTVPGEDPYSVKTPLIFGTGPLTGTVCGTGRFNVTSKSPITNILADSNCGGHWAPELKYAGYDHLLIEGESEKPVYLLIIDDCVEIRDASHLWGKDVWQTTEELRREIGDPDLQVAAIGQAGENKVKHAAVIASIGRAAGRCGTGAVMGAKRLKAIAVRGTKGVNIADPEGLERALEEAYQRITTSQRYDFYPKYGTTILTETSTGVGRATVKNFSSTVWPHLDKIGGNVFLEKYSQRSKACYGCFIHCDHYYQVSEGPYAGTRGPGLEWETIAAFGLRCNNSDFPSVLLANNLANQYGMDVISAGTAISLAIELYELGILTKADTDGIELRWGDPQLVLDLLRKMALREGFGDLLAEGPYHMAKKIGRGAEKRVMHVKGLDQDGGENRGFKGAALSYAVSTRGGEHLRGLIRTEMSGWLSKEEAIRRFGSADVTDATTYDTVGKPRAVITYERLSLIADCFQICKFNTFWSGFPMWEEQIHNLFTAVTGSKLSLDEVLKATDRIYCIEKAYNIREGQVREDDIPCERWLKEQIPDGVWKGALIEEEGFRKMLDSYYSLRGWDLETGAPTREKLEELDLPEIAAELESMGKLPVGTKEEGGGK